MEQRRQQKKCGEAPTVNIVRKIVRSFTERCATNQCGKNRKPGEDRRHGPKAMFEKSTDSVSRSSKLRQVTESLGLVLVQLPHVSTLDLSTPTGNHLCKRSRWLDVWVIAINDEILIGEAVLIP